MTELLIHPWSFKISINQQCGLMAGQGTRSCREFLGIASQSGPVPLLPARCGGGGRWGDSPLAQYIRHVWGQAKVGWERRSMGMAVWHSWDIAQVGNKSESFSLQVWKGRNAPRYLSGDTEAAPSFLHRAYALTGSRSPVGRDML